MGYKPLAKWDAHPSGDNGDNGNKIAQSSPSETRVAPGQGVDITTSLQSLVTGWNQHVACEVVMSQIQNSRRCGAAYLLVHPDFYV